MKQIKTLSLAVAALSIFSIAQGQDIRQSEVPSIIVKAFTGQFPKAVDVEWKMKGELYKVEFEVIRHMDQEVWYDKSGKIVKHKEEISEKELPEKIRNVIKKEFPGYKTNDLERKTENGKTVYKMELKSSLQQDWDIVIDADGKIVSKKAD